MVKDNIMQDSRGKKRKSLLGEYAQPDVLLNWEAMKFKWFITSLVALTPFPSSSPLLSSGFLCFCFWFRDGT